MADYSPANTIVNGYFYSFVYNPPTYRKGYDATPLVFVVGPSTISLKNFVGINLHHLPPSQREFFIRNFQRTYRFMESQRMPIDQNQCEQLLPGITIAMRSYNREYVTDCVRIAQDRVPYYIFSDGHISQETPDNTAMKWIEERGLYVVKEHNK